MKLFAIITAGLMAAGGGVYFYSTSTCSESGCGKMPVATSGGCCTPSETPDCCATQDECCLTAKARVSVKLSCCAAKDECCLIPEACCAIAATVGTATKPACCTANEECCIAGAACCTAEKAFAVAKPIKIVGCCDEVAVSPTRTVATAAQSIVGVK